MKVLECPYCESKNVELKFIKEKEEPLLYYSCALCGLSGPYMETQSDAILAWNRVASQGFYVRKMDECRDKIMEILKEF